MNNMDDMQEMLAALNSPPFNKKYTLVSLAKILESGSESFDLLKDVCQVYQATMLQQSEEEQTQIDLQQMSVEEASLYITQKYAVLSFENENATYDEQAFAKTLTQAQSQQTFTILYQLLTNNEQAMQTVYTHQFTMNIVNGNYPVDQQLVKQRLEQISLFSQEYQKLQDKKSQDIEKKFFEQKQIANQLDSQNEKLQTKLSGLQQQINSSGNDQVNDYIQLAGRIREAEQAQKLIKMQIQECQENKAQFLQKIQQMVQQSQGTPEQLLDAARSENLRLQQRLLDLPHEIEEKKRIKKLLIEDVTAEQVAMFEEELETIRGKYRNLVEATGVGDQLNNKEDQLATNTLTSLRQSLTRFVNKESQIKEKLTTLKGQNALLDNKINQQTQTLTQDNIDSIDSLPQVFFRDFVLKSHFIKDLGLQISQERNMLKKQIVFAKRTNELLREQVNAQGGVSNMDNGDQEAWELLNQLEQTVKQKRSENLIKINEFHSQKQKLNQLEQDLNQVRSQLQSDALSNNQTIFKLKVQLDKLIQLNQSKSVDISNLKLQIQELQVRNAVTCSEEFVQKLIKRQEEIKEKIKNEKDELQERKNKIRDAGNQKKMLEDMKNILQAKIQSTKEYKKDEIADNGEHVRLQ